jgi:hypothetical protein
MTMRKRSRPSLRSRILAARKRLEADPVLRALCKAAAEASEKRRGMSDAEIDRWAACLAADADGFND